MNTKDPLAGYRNQNNVLPLKENEAGALMDDGEYHAFHAIDKDPKALSILASSTAWMHAQYSFLQYVTEDGGRGRRFCIVYGFMVVDVRGRNLRPVVHAIKMGNCEFIQAFDASRWKKSADTSEPFIDSIQFHHGAEKRGEMLGKQKNPENQEA